MITTSIIGLIAVWFAYLAKYQSLSFGLKVSFLIIFVFLAFRYKFGNDYLWYFNNFDDLNSLSLEYALKKSARLEPGWVLLCRIFKPFGFFYMTAFLALFNCLVYYRFIKKYVPVQFYWLAVVLYIFSPGFMLVHSSAMRQSVAIALFILSIDYMYKKDVARYFILIVLAALFHYSAIILFPLIFLGFVNLRISNFSIILFFSVYILLFLFIRPLSPVINNIISTSFDKYGSYEGATEIGTGLGLVYNSILLILVLYFHRFQDDKKTILFKLAVISYLFIPLSLNVQMIGRVGMYFAPTTILVFPIILSTFKNPMLRIGFLFTLLLITFYSYFQFFQSEVWKPYFGKYHTIFSAAGMF